MQIPKQYIIKNISRYDINLSDLGVRIFINSSKDLLSLKPALAWENILKSRESGSIFLRVQKGLIEEVIKYDPAEVEKEKLEEVVVLDKVVEVIFLEKDIPGIKVIPGIVEGAKEEIREEEEEKEEVLIEKKIELPSVPFVLFDDKIEKEEPIKEEEHIAKEEDVVKTPVVEKKKGKKSKKG